MQRVAESGIGKLFFICVHLSLDFLDIYERGIRNRSAVDMRCWGLELMVWRLQVRKCVWTRFLSLVPPLAFEKRLS